LPDLTRIDRLAPNVTFAVPKGLFNFLRANTPDDVLKGAAKKGSDEDPSWLCGFNIPIITICAFILLNILLTILNLVFWWLPFIKICIPVPSSWRRALPTEGEG
jgi:hypothetical protein